jgi:hypothetical protein
MVEIRPDEVSAILRQQLSGFKNFFRLTGSWYRIAGW